ncbi:hypothetical protein [Thalassotalea ganghwensis]
MLNSKIKVCFVFTLLFTLSSCTQVKSSSPESENIATELNGLAHDQVIQKVIDYCQRYQKSNNLEQTIVFTGQESFAKVTCKKKLNSNDND